MKTLEELLLCIEDDMELFDLSHIIYLMEKDGQTVDYDYLPSEQYTEAVTLKELHDELQRRRMLESVAAASAAEKNDVPVKKLAVLFPGIGYTLNKPLLYYSARLARQHGYEILSVPYTGFPENIRGDARKMKEAFSIALSQAENILQNVDWDSFTDILFLSKSVGTVVSTMFAKRHHLKVRNILFTPLAETFSLPTGTAIAFHGTADPWADTKQLQQLSEERKVPLFLTEHADHSLETGDVQTDLQILEAVLKQTEHFLSL